MSACCYSLSVGCGSLSVGCDCLLVGVTLRVGCDCMFVECDYLWVGNSTPSTHSLTVSAVEEVLPSAVAKHLQQIV